MSEARIIDSTSILDFQNLARGLTHNKNTINIWMNEWLLCCVAESVGQLVCWESCLEQSRERKVNQSWIFLSVPNVLCILTPSQAFGNTHGSCQKIYGKQKSFRSEKKKKKKFCGLETPEER